MSLLENVSFVNCRSLGDISVKLGSINCFFGPNGAGKSTLLDAITLVRDFIASNALMAYQSHGGASSFLSRTAASTASTSIALTSDDFTYSIAMNSILAQFNAAPDERLSGADDSRLFFQRGGPTLKTPWDSESDEQKVIHLADPNQSAWTSFLTGEAPFGAFMTYATLRGIRYFHARKAALDDIKGRGSPSGPGSTISTSGAELWSALRNLRDAQKTSIYYAKIVEYLVRAFPGFQGFEFLQSGPANVSCNIIERRLREPYPVYFAPDGLVQMTVNLSALFSDGPGDFTILLDEPDLSLHPWALFVLSEAIEDATTHWNRQVLLATHSPVLLGQFSEDQLFLMMPQSGSTTVQRVSEIEDAKDLLAQYSTGALYMSQLIGEQSPEPMVTLEPINE